MFNLFPPSHKTQKPKPSVSKTKFKSLRYQFDSKLHSHAVERVLQCYLIAESQLQQSFIRPEINFKLRGKSAGTAHLHQNLLRFNATLLAENQDTFFNEVIPHEICHLLAHQMYGRVKPHGREWQALMIRVFKLSPSTTHSMDTQSVAGKHFSYQCDCGPVSLSIRRHNKVVRGETQYRCRRCKKELTLNL
ncbi:SprT family zinc-dependent metalloprotease [Shewanella sp. D64]|uniref:SprT family zinc-dependent metalloprotease n=1 Tax=unclassified Shewanella TaxID=196818 RepID=UPI0022BA3572|nr:MULTISPECIES: SprT family zinc-dependent metalloprotease [unclassified Shewanella]MEC4728764.1 SprT family zinc-dependent metalloprotease [Shewanella sp. D64]MEC4740210.1 SprT family zinc-dependent metalloprotease [Shewanella sp. E94]WBJ96260.1 SprT family zinc-dependent metalloprotease [Shewanella sp. MTB7]